MINRTISGAILCASVFAGLGVDGFCQAADNTDATVGVTTVVSDFIKMRTVDNTGATVRFVTPENGAVLDDVLATRVAWTYPHLENLEIGGKPPALVIFYQMQLVVSEHADMSDPIVDVRRRDNETSYRFAMRPGTTYYCRIIPWHENAPHPEFGDTISFTSGTPRIDTTEDLGIRYLNPREGAHYMWHQPVSPADEESLSPWYAVKSYRTVPPPSFESIQSRFPVPIYDGHPDALDAYWYAWKTLMSVWLYAPDEPNHQAVSNIIGIPSWGPWGSTMVWDTAFILYFAKYGHQAYPFIQGYDNCYARQHENGFICRETDRNNREVYVVFPVNPPLFAWAEWEYYQVSGDRERLRQVFLPIVKHYEWWMIYQRRENGLYWTNGAQEADDSPRNGLMFYGASATSYQAMTALFLKKIAEEIGRPDMAEFFDAQHRELGKIVNDNFWDENHRIYNDKAKDGRFITELEPGKFCKHCHMFWPLLAQVCPQDRLQGMVDELKNPATFLRRTGIASLSADSDGYTGGPDGSGQYWRGAVWPPIQCMVQTGLKYNGHWNLARDIALRYHAALLQTYMETGDITENMAPDQVKAFGAGKFVGWGGIAPIANLIEYILGFDINVPQKTIVWRINETGRHGMTNVKLVDFNTDLICEARENADAPCRISVNSGGDFTLILMIAGTERLRTVVTKGTHRFTVTPE